MRGGIRARWLTLPCLLGLAAGILLAGCTAPVPDGGQGPGQPTVTTTTPAGLPSYLVHVPGEDHGTVLLIGRSNCPWCLRTKDLLANLSVGYYWVDLNTLDEAETAEVINSLGMCGQLESVPVLVINNQPPCIVGFQEERIREALE